VLCPLFFEIITENTGGYFFGEILNYIVLAVGLGEQPTIYISITMGFTEYLDTIMELPAGLSISEEGLSRLPVVQ